jgi:inner membrane protein involved in colicin E2 resistance
MFPHATPAAPANPALSARSMGVKLMIVCLLALLMSSPAVLISDLVDQRSDTFAKAHVATSSAPAHALFGLVRVVNPYQSVNRSLKYAPLFLSLIFLSYFLFEASTRKRVHPAQYVLVGVAQTIFYLLLLSLAEKIGFDLAFLIAGAATVVLFSMNTGWVFAAPVYARRSSVLFGAVYTLIYLLLRLEDNALLLGSMASFAAVATAMYLTRNLDWYSSFGPATLPGHEPPPLVPGTLQ